MSIATHTAVPDAVRSRCVSAPSGGRVSRLAAGVLFVLALVSPSHLSAQGALSAQGFGYPPGGLSARSLGLGGATAEFDYLSARNPAALAEIRSSVLSVQGEPERRRVRFGDITEQSTLQRIPLVAAALRVQGIAFMISGHTLLDRTYLTESQGTEFIGETPISTADRFDVRGAMNELRLAMAWRWKQLSFGAGVVAISGQHTVARTRAFPDSLLFGGVLDSTRIGFEGVGAVLGVNWRATADLLFGASWRAGGGLRAVRGDDDVSEASVPGRLGGGVLYQGIAGTVLAVNVEQVNWSAMNGLGTEASEAQDAMNWSVGAEVVGGSLRRSPVLWRVGYRKRDLPFLLNGSAVSETAIHGGLGLPIAGEFASLDLALQRALRRVVGDVAEEDAWGLSVGITLRP